MIDIPQNQADAQHLLNQIQTFSVRFLDAMKLPTKGSPHGGDRPLRASGIVMHYAADPRLEVVLRWFSDPLSYCSSHFVVSTGKHPRHDALAADLPLVAALPATVVQMRGLQQEAWHATWANAWAYGIELCNAGELAKQADGNYRPVSEVPYVASDVPVLPWGDRRFAGYPDAQLAAAHALGRSLALVSAIQASRVVAHDMVQGAKTKVRGALGHDKRDMGGFDLEGLRRLFLGTALPSDSTYSAHLAKAATASLMRRTSGPDPHLAKLRLEALGYVSDPSSVQWSTEEKDSLFIFQMLMGLVPDRLCGSKTEAALLERCRDRWQLGS